uniref:hypothetical protein n=1 Tax=Lacrimispora sp. TaxID=2719234 RepID=UPI00289BBE8B
HYNGRLALFKYTFLFDAYNAPQILYMNFFSFQYLGSISIAGGLLFHMNSFLLKRNSPMFNRLKPINKKNVGSVLFKHTPTFSLEQFFRRYILNWSDSDQKFCPGCFSYKEGDILELIANFIKVLMAQGEYSPFLVTIPRCR